MNQRTFTEPTDNKNRFLGFSLILTEVGCMIGYGLSGSFRNDANGLTILRTEVVSVILMFIFVAVGFGMLLNVYRFGNWLGSTTAIIILAISIQLSPLMQKFWFSVIITGFGSRTITTKGTPQATFFSFYTNNNIEASPLLLRTTLLSCISIMVVMSAAVGRINLSQIVKFVAFFQIMWCCNYFLLIYFLVVHQDFNDAEYSPYFFDMFGTTYVYLFAAAFGLPFVAMLRKQRLPQVHPRNQFNRLSLMLSQIGTGIIVAMFVFTSSQVIDYTTFNNSIGQNNARFAILFAIIGSIIGTYIGSAIVGRGRVGYKEALVGTFSGGIIIGGVAPIIYNIGIIIMIGTIAGFVSGIYMRAIHVKINKNHIKDVLGLFGPFFWSAFLGSFVVTPAVVATYYNKGINFPFTTTSPPLHLAGYQLIYVGITVGIGLVGGVITGLFNLCDNDYFALASNSRVYENEFGLFDLGEVHKSRSLLPTPGTTHVPGTIIDKNAQILAPSQSQNAINRSSNLL